jgi:hypothetical protein
VLDLIDKAGVEDIDALQNVLFRYSRKDAFFEQSIDLLAS